MSRFVAYAKLADKRGHVGFYGLMVLDALFYRLHNAGPWRDMPEGFGPWRTIYGWYRRWAR